MANVDIGIVGAGVMGSNLALNICDKGFRVALYDTNPAQIATVLEGNAAYASKLSGFAEKENLGQFIQALRKPRKVIILVPAGKVTDAVIQDLAGLMDSNDVIIDVGNAHFRDQDRRAEELEARGLRFLGMGVSGGAEGARKGPAFFPGGTLSVWEDIKEIVEAAAAKAEDGRPCVTMNGKGGAGSCVKMFHNAGEYAVLQVWGEVHEIMKSYGLSTVDQKRILSGWKTKKCGRFDGFLSSYMLDITVEVVGAEDSEVAGGQSDGSPLLSKTMDKTDSKGTGLWSVVEALQAAVPVPTLAAAVLARQMSMMRDERHANANKVPFPSPPAVEGAKWTDELETDLFNAAAMSILASYAQMFQSLRKLDQIFGFGVQLPATIATFRAGCILQGFMLSPMTKAFEEDPNLSNLIAAFEPEIREGLPSFKRLISHATGETNSTIPCMYASLDYVQTMLSKEIPSAQCVSLQRDVFGRHGFERLDKEGRFNASWQQLQAGDAATTEAKSAVVKDV
jgi:6-phosphogluconate dehydrogenase